MVNETFACPMKSPVFYSFHHHHHSVDYYYQQHRHYDRASRYHENYYRYQTMQLESQDRISIANEIESIVVSIVSAASASWISRCFDAASCFYFVISEKPIKGMKHHSAAYYWQQSA